MKTTLAIIGSGNIGSAFAFHLAKAGHDVTLVARPGSKRLDELRRDGGIALTTGEIAPIPVIDALDEQRAFDLVIVTVLSHQVDAILPALQRCKARGIHFMFNTFQPERLRDAVGDGRCSFGMPFIMARLEENGCLNATISAGRKTLHGDRRWVELFSQAGIPSAFEPDMPLWLRCHAPLCIAMESIAVKAQQRGGGASWADARAVTRGLHGGFATVKALKYPLYPKAKKTLNSLPDIVIACLLWTVSRVASFRDLLATGKNECRALIDAVAQEAEHHALGSSRSLQALKAIKPDD